MMFKQFLERFPLIEEQEMKDSYRRIDQNYQKSSSKGADHFKIMNEVERWCINLQAKREEKT